MKDDLITEKELIAPCGMNCSICSGYLAFKHDVKSKGVRMPYCAGCRPRDKKCAFLKKKCDFLLNNEVVYCYQCKEFSCDNLLRIDKRYRSFFKMSMIENLEFIKKSGITNFLKKENEKWKCKNCGELICCHNGICFNCELDKLKNKKKLYRWEDD
jgi:hypothetical protein